VLELDRAESPVPALAPPGSLRRSWQLLRAFRLEQSDPDRFYGLLARDSARQLAAYADLRGASLLDVGGGPGYFASAFRASGARYAAVDADLGELSLRSTPGLGTVLGSGLALPVRTDSVDICYSSNVLEHVPEPQAMAEEMLRVTRPSGIVFLSWTTWWSPWGGHETAPWHYLGGAYAARRYGRRHGHPPKNEFGRTLFATHARPMLRWARTTPHGELVDVFARYHPRWAGWVARVPAVGEVAAWNVVLVLRAR
jgi:SAM-dependent methyltransferase